MGCSSCGKRRARPAKRRSADQGRNTSTTVPEEARPAPTATPAPTVNRSAQRIEKYTLTTKDGRTTTFGSKLEARAAQVRAGGGTLKRA